MEVINPPITARAIGALASAPAPMASASGSMPKIIATVVMMIGRRRIRPAESSEAARSPPSARSWLVKSTSRMPFFVTSPINMMTPIIVMTFMFPPVMRSARATPMKLRGRASMIARGCRKDPKRDARMR